mmetsp:Transcript_1808/g.2531  ORF Transcript_1808/g.2531 Transcript_1808/m.2531 type:complete len:286 (-) Transcript_1808:62-919(-)
MKSQLLLLLPVVATAFSPSSSFTRSSHVRTVSSSPASPALRPITELQIFKTKTEEKSEIAVSTTTGTLASDDSSEGDWIDESKKVELILLGIWGISISAFILINNFYGPWPLFMKTVPERVFFLNHMIGGMLFGGGIILTTCIERLVAKSANAPVLQFWFDKVPVLDGLIVVPALTVSMISGTGLAIVRYGGLNIAPPHVGAIFWTLIAFMTWWAATDLTTQGTALQAVEKMYDQYEQGERENLETPKVVTDRHVSNVVSCFFVLLLYSMMVLKPGTFFPWPWNA